MQLAVCIKCHKLHNVKDIIAYKDEGKVTVMNCLYKEFSNNFRSYQYNNSLSVLKKIKMQQLLYPKCFTLNQVFVNN